jgi:hypothetical protein
MTCKNRDLLALLNAAWQDYGRGALRMLRLPQEIEAVRFAVQHLKRGDRELAEAECRKFAGSHALWQLAMEEKQEEIGNE